jgi:hypothetical protein
MDIGNLDHAKLTALKKRLQESAQEKYLEESRKRLDKIISQKIRTTFIGSLAVFEECFGFMWGHGKAKEDLTEQEEMMREVWEDARSRILNKSNNQLRAVRSELNNHVVHWNRHRMDFAVKPLSEETTDEKDV